MIIVIVTNHRNLSDYGVDIVKEVVYRLYQYHYKDLIMIFITQLILYSGGTIRNIRKCYHN